MNRLFLDVLAPQTREVDRIKSLVSAATAELQWYDAFRIEEARLTLAEQKAQIAETALKIEASEAEYAQLKNNLARLQEKAEFRLNPTQWFSKERRTAATGVLRLKKEREALLSSQVALERTHGALREQCAGLSKEIARHESFRADEARTQVSRGRELVATAQSRLMELDAACRKVDEELGGLSKEVVRIEHEQTAARMQLSRALALQQQLDRASNSYEKAMTHQACEREFGIGNPNRVTQKLEGKIKSAERDIQKLSDRFRRAVAQSLRTIRTLVIDGSNCCYTGEDFLGLKPLIAIVPKLAEHWEVTVVFDASIRSRLSTDDQGIRGKLEPFAKVHVMATKQKADEFLLDLAANDETWVISRDRFADFPEKKVVKEQRLMRQEIFDGTFSVPDLKVQTSY